MIESYSMLTPRGLSAPVAASESAENEKQILEGFLLPKRSDGGHTDDKLEYMLFVWNGKNSSPFLKVHHFHYFLSHFAIVNGIINGV
jgi:hypothetical protein